MSRLGVTGAVKGSHDVADFGVIAGRATWVGDTRGTPDIRDHGIPAHDQALHMIITRFRLFCALSSETSGKR